MLTRLYLMVASAQELCFVIEHHKPFDARARKILYELAQIIPDGKVTGRPTLLGSVVQVGPRMSMMSPWSSSAIEILEGCGIEAERFEMFRRYAIPKGVDKQAFAASVFDEMTEQIYDRHIKTFSKEVEIPKVKIVPVLEKGPDALRQINEELGLGFDEQDIGIYHRMIEKMKRNPTDAEMFDLGQANSDHCRHRVFNGEWTIDGAVQKETLFDLIRKPYFEHPGNSLTAFHDDSSVIRGFPVRMAFPRKPWTSSEYMIITVHADGTLTVETHNHPSGVSPYPGAATGTGGRMRDRFAVGRGGLWFGVALAGFFTGNLNLPGYRLPWEKSGEKYPPNLATARDIIRFASDGACDYNNPVGEPVILGCSRAVEMKMPDGTKRAWFKPIMLSGGISLVRREHVRKAKPTEELLIIEIGGPGFNVGFGGGAAASQTSGENKAKKDLLSVQRGDPEMAIRDHRVICACTAMGRLNPILLIHDQGAGGVGNVLKELIEKIGGVIYAGRIRLGDKYLPFIVIWGAEYQERYGILIHPSGLRLFRKICERENCPLEILGRTTGDGRVVVYNDIKGDNPKPIDFDLKTVMAGLPQKKFTDVHVIQNFRPIRLPDNVGFGSALNRVLKNLAVASKEHYTLKGDRSVQGQVIQQQHCGPANLPVADCGAMALSHFDRRGQVFSIGEQPLKLMLDPAAGARMAATEACMNMAPALITSVEDIRSSVNWMWGVKYPGEGAALFDACRALSEFMLRLGVPDRGKDSSSMITKFDGEVVPAPRQVIITMRAMMPDVQKLVTPDIKRPGRSELWRIDLGQGLDRMGGSILGQCYNQWGNDCPDITADLLRRTFNAIQRLVRDDLILSYHDRSDGGLIVTLLEMAFSGNCGLSIIGLQSRNILRTLFSEEAGAAIEVDPDSVEETIRVLSRFGVPFDCIGKPIKEDIVLISANDQPVFFQESMPALRQTWRETSYQLRRLQINPNCALLEKKNTRTRKGISYVMPENWDGKARFKMEPTKNQPKVAILREIGTNSDAEMVASFMMAGFRPVDVDIKDLEKGVVKNLNEFSVLAACGGFSNGDVLGSARGWAAKILYNEKLFRIFWEFIKRDDTLSYWVCNGAQLGLQLGWFPFLPEDGRPAKGHPVFTYNASKKFEARWSLVEVGLSRSIMLRGLEGSKLGVHVAHGEGRFYCSDIKLLSRIAGENLAPVRFVDDAGNVTERYPFNPNGSPLGITGVTTPCGRHTLAMPHFERSVQMRQWQYVPEDLKGLENSPWLRAFENMRNHYR